MNLSEIIQEVESRNIPEDIAVKTEWVEVLVEYSKKVSPATACLIYSARENNFRMNKSEWISWAMEKFKFTSKSHVHKCRRVGEILLEASDEIFKKLVTVSFDKLYSISILDPDQIDGFARTHDMEKLSREEVRSEVNKIMGKEEIIEEAKDKNTGKLKKFYAAAFMVANMSVPELMEAVEKTDMTGVLAMLEAGKKLFAAGMEGIPRKNINNIGILNRIETYLKEQLKDINTQKTRAMLAGGTPQIGQQDEQKTA